MSDYERLIKAEVSILQATTVKPPHVTYGKYKEALELIAIRTVKARQSVVDAELSKQNLERIS